MSRRLGRGRVSEAVRRRLDDLLQERIEGHHATRISYQDMVERERFMDEAFEGTSVRTPYRAYNITWDGTNANATAPPVPSVNEVQGGTILPPGFQLTLYKDAGDQ